MFCGGLVKIDANYMKFEEKMELKEKVHKRAEKV
jgi:hypothetical protein